MLAALYCQNRYHDHIGDRLNAKFVALGPQTVKNIARPIEAFKVDFGSGTSSDVICFGAFEIDEALFELR